ncbi:MAG: hypothetical protein ABI960_04180, partial [Candidatus Eisenbacteria bacterium]
MPAPVGAGARHHVERALLPGAAPGDAPAGETGAHVGVRVAEPVDAPNRHQRHARAHRVEKCLAARGARAMVPDLEQRARRQSGVHQRVLDQRVGVAHEQNAQRVGGDQLDQEDHGLAVRRPPGILAETGRRPQAAHAIAGTAPKALPAHDLERPRGPRRAAALPHRPEDAAGHVARTGHPAAGHVAHDRRQPAEMIEVAMGREHGVERVGAARAQRRHEHARPLVERGVGHAAVDQHRAAVGKTQQHAVALPDVEQRPHERRLARERPRRDDRRCAEHSADARSSESQPRRPAPRPDPAGPGPQ